MWYCVNYRFVIYCAVLSQYGCADTKNQSTGGSTNDSRISQIPRILYYFSEGGYEKMATHKVAHVKEKFLNIHVWLMKLMCSHCCPNSPLLSHMPLLSHPPLPLSLSYRLCDLVCGQLIQFPSYLSLHILYLALCIIVLGRILISSK